MSRRKPHVRLPRSLLDRAAALAARLVERGEWQAWCRQHGCMLTGPDGAYAPRPGATAVVAVAVRQTLDRLESAEASLARLESQLTQPKPRWGSATADDIARARRNLLGVSDEG